MSSSQESFTLGVEEEYQIVSPRTWELSSSSGPVLRGAQQALGDQAQPELHLSQVEAATPVCQNLQEVRSELIHMRTQMISAAEQKSMVLVAAGTHPFSHWKSQRVTPKERYKALAAYYQQLARESIFGCHVHVGLNDRALRLQVMNRARIWLAPLLALAANSPFWQGEDTGYASFRSVMWSRWPTSGQPQQFESLEEYDALLRALIASGCIDDATNIYWDIRLSERFGTIEFRVTDCCLTVDETVLIVGLIQALVQTCYEQVRKGKPVPNVRPELLRAAHWRAARFGLDDELIDVVGQRSLPAAELIAQMVEMVHPVLETNGNMSEISTLLEQILREGNGAMRQRDVYNKNERMEELVEYMAAETRKGVM